MATEATPTPITPAWVPIIDPQTGAMNQAWYLFFLSLFEAAKVAYENQITGPDAISLAASLDEAIRTLQQELQTQPVSVVEQVLPLIDALAQRLDTLASPETGELQQQINTIRQELEVIPRPELGTMSQLQQAWLPWVTFDNAPEVLPPDVGTLAWDGGTTLGVQMTANVVGRVNESGYYYIKASSGITKGQVVMFTGAVGASGVPTGAPATGVTDGSYIMGIAAESLALNAFGLVQFIGTLKGIDTSAFADGDILWYDPATSGGLTKTKPTAPDVKVQMAAVITSGSGGSGSILIRVNSGSVLGGTDSNVQFGTLTDGDLIQYDGTLQYWKNVAVLGVAHGGTGLSTVPTNGQLLIGNGTGYTAATLTAGSNITVTNAAGGITIAATGSGGGPVGSVTSVGLSLPSEFTVTGSPVTTTGTLTGAWANQTANKVFASPNGSTGTPTFRALVAADIPTAALTKTDDTNVTLTLGGSPTTALVNAASLTLGWTGQLGVSRGGTGQSSYTDGQLLIGNSVGNTLTKATLTAGSNITITNGNGSITIAATSSGGTPTLNVVTGTTQSAAANNHYVLTNAAATTVTLPATPSAGDIVWVTVGNGLTTNVIARNGEKIQSIAEDCTLNAAYAAVQLRYVNATIGWTFT